MDSHVLIFLKGHHPRIISQELELPPALSALPVPAFSDMT